MRKWADYLISKVKYDKNHLISVAIRHKDTLNGITEGKPIDRLSISSDIKNGLVYITIYSGNNSWKKGNKIRTFSIDGFPYLRIDKNKAKLDYFGDLPEPDTEEEATPEQLAKLEQLEQQIQELESQPKSVSIPAPRGLLPKDTSEELSQELDLSPSTEPDTEEEATPEQLAKLEQLEQQIQELESQPKSVSIPAPRGLLPKDTSEELSQELDLSPSTEPDTEEEATPEQLAKLEQLEQQIQELESQPKSVSIPAPRGLLPKDTSEELSQELDLSPSTEPDTEEEATPEQLAKLEQLEQQIQELESQPEPDTEEEATPEQLAKLEQLEQQIQELESQPKSVSIPAPRGLLPKDTSEELSQELDLSPSTEPDTEEEATPEQLAKLEQLEQQIQELESQPEPDTEEEATPEQLAKLEQLEQQIQELESQPKSVSIPAPRGLLPKDTSEELSQELDLSPSTEPDTEEEATPEQLAKLEQLEQQIQELESQPKSVSIPAPRGLLPKDTSEELSQELDLSPSTEPDIVEESVLQQLAKLEQLEQQIQELESQPEPDTEEEATPEQLTPLDDLQNQINELEDELSFQNSTVSFQEEATPEQLTPLDDLQNQINELEQTLETATRSSNDNPEISYLSSIKKLEQEIKILEEDKSKSKFTKTLRKQNKKLNEIEKKISNIHSNSNNVYCVKCKTKRSINNPEETILKNGRIAITGTCRICNCKVFRIGKISK